MRRLRSVVVSYNEDEDVGAPVSAPVSAPISTPVSAPISAPLEPDNGYWADQTKLLGYPRPQGSLSNFNWGLRPEARLYYQNLYDKVLR